MTTIVNKAGPRPAPAPDIGPWRAETGALLRLGWPLALTQLATVAMSTTDVVMMGWLGPTELAAGVLASSLVFPCIFFGIGILTTVAAFCAQDLGARRYKGVRRTVRQGVWIAILISMPFSLFIWNGRAIMIATGQDPEVSALAEGYLHATVFQVLPAFVFIVLRNFTSAHNRPRAALVVIIVAIGVNAIADYGLMFGNFGLPRLELVGAGIATAVVQVFMALVMGAYVLRDRRYRRYHLAVRFWKPDWPRFRQMLRVGIPTGFMVLAEVVLFSAAGFMIGRFGADQLAGHAVALQCASVTFMIPLGLSQAATVRVGLAVGRGDALGIGRAGYAALGAGLLVMAPGVLAFWFLGEPLTSLYLDLEDPASQSAVTYAVSFLAVAAVFQVVDGIQVLCAGVLRGLNDTRTPMLIAIVSYVGLGISAAWCLGFEAGLEGAGVWWGFAVGLAAAAVALTWRFARRHRLGLIAVPPV